MSHDLSSSPSIPEVEPVLSSTPSMADHWDRLPLMLKAEFFYALAPVIEKRANAGLPPPCLAAFSLTFEDGSALAAMEIQPGAHLGQRLAGALAQVGVVADAVEGLL